MNLGDQQNELVIIGANPSGLILATQLLRYGLQPVIIDSKSSSSKVSPSISLHSGSLEIFNQLGILEEILEQGLLCRGLNIQLEKEIIKHKTYADFALHSEFPFVFNISQKKIEEVLIKYLARKACPIYWDAKVLSFRQDDKMVEVEIQKDNKLNKRTFKWIVVADGSQVELKEQFSYNQWTIKRPLYQLDLQTSEQHNRNMHLVVSKDVFVLGSPIDSHGRYDFIGSFPSGDVVINQSHKLKEVLDQSLGFSIPVESFNWIRTFDLYAIRASEYLKQRIILVGEASFSQSGFCGNSINNGIQGAHNLGWKLANVCLGIQAETILHSYEEERKAIDNRHFRRNYWLSRVLISSAILPLVIRKRIINKVLKCDSLFTFNSNYRKNSLTLHHSLEGTIKAGDHVPYLKIYDEKKKEETDLHTWCKKPGFVLLLLGNLSSHSLFIMAQWMKQKYTSYMHLFYLPYSSKNNSVFEAFDVQPGHNKMILVRPDMHIAYMHDVVSANLIDTYMTEVMKWN